MKVILFLIKLLFKILALPTAAIASVDSINQVLKGFIKS